MPLISHVSNQRWRCLPSVAILIFAMTVATGRPALAEERLLRETVDHWIQSAWKSRGIEPAGLSSDAVFLRRAYLDLLGIIPDYETTVAFLADPDSAKRAKLIDRLLEDPRFGLHQADVWDMILFGRNPTNNEARTRDGFLRWLQNQFQDNVPFDQVASAILKASGNTVDDGAPMFLMQYRSRPEDAAEAVSQIFMGVQLQCARCHDHPFETWTQLDFYGMAAFFARLEMVTVGKEGNVSKYAVGEKNRGDILFTGPAAQQEPGKKGEPVGAKFLKESPLVEPPVPESLDEPRNFPSNKMPPAPLFSRKDALADWIARPENPWFARAAANRIWGQFLGRGLVHPVDNMSPSNAPSHPELLYAMTQALVDHQFDLKWLIRELCNSQTYQLADHGPVTEALPLWFERAKVRPLSAEELVESWRVATGYDAVLAKGDKKISDRFAGVTSGYMLRFFGEPNNGTGDFQGGLQEHLYMNNGQVRQLIGSQEGTLLHRLSKPELASEQRVEQLYLWILNRSPKPEEAVKFAEFLAAEDSRQLNTNLQDAIWVLLTCSEFRFNH